MVGPASHDEYENLNVVFQVIMSTMNADMFSYEMDMKEALRRSFDEQPAAPPKGTDNLDTLIEECFTKPRCTKKKKTAHQSSVSDDTLPVCSICFGPISFGYTLPCNHTFHSRSEDCCDGTIKTWLSQHDTCPVCRTKVTLGSSPADSTTSTETDAT